MRIRPATDADAESLCRLGGQMVQTHAGFDSRRFLHGSELTADRYGRFLLDQIRDEDAIVLLADAGDRIAGYAFAAVESESLKELRGRAGYIHDLLVDEASRGQGIGRALLTAVLDGLHERKVPRVLLVTATQNAAAQHLFKQFGFRQTMLEFTREWPS